METSLIYLERDGCGRAALRLQPAATETRTPTHFLALIDISESMADSGKLAHVKHCMRLLLKFLTPVDQLTLITFGEESSVVLKRVKADAAALSTMEAAIDALRVNGCTNLSAGLASVRQVLDDIGGGGAGAPAVLKPGLLLLTDGHANRGVTDPASLKSMVGSLADRFGDLSFSFVAYGTDHNAELLRSMAEARTAPYSIVNDLEGAALAMGEALGGIISCCAQNVVAQFPAGTKAIGAYKAEADGRVRIGDLYAGSEVLVLLELPALADSAAAPEIRLHGVSLPSLDPFTTVVQSRLETERNVDIELARLRIECSELFRRIREEGLRSATELREAVERFRVLVTDEAFNGNPVAELLRQEVPSLTTALDMLGRYGGGGAALTSLLSAHQQYTALGRGTSQPIGPDVVVGGPPAGGGAFLQRAGAGPRMVRWRGGAQTPDYGSDVEESDPTTGPPAPNARTTSYLSPTASTATRRVAVALQTMSSQGGSVEPEETHSQAVAEPRAPVALAPTSAAVGPPPPAWLTAAAGGLAAAPAGLGPTSSAS